MNTIAVIILIVGIFAYTEAAIGIGYYMYLKSQKKETTNKEDTGRKETIRYSIIAGVLFPVTLAIMAAYKAAERK